MVYPYLIAALVTMLAHHIHNAAEMAPSAAEMRIYKQLLADLDTMVLAGDNPDLEAKRNFCKCLLSTLEARHSACAIGGNPGCITVTS